MKRRIIALATVTVLTFALSACGATEESNSSTPTVEQSSQTVTVEPTQAPTEAPTQAPTEAPEVTVEPTETPAEPTEVPSINVAEDPNFAVIKEMVAEHIKWNEEWHYDELEALIETLDKSRYEVAAVDNLDLVADKVDHGYDIDTYEEILFAEGFIFDLAEITTEDGDTDYIDVVPTGEFYVMTLTDNVTGETIVWGLKVHTESIDNPGEYYVLTYSSAVFNTFGYHMPIKDCYTRY